MSGRRETVAFKDPVILNEMLSLRKDGWSYNSLGVKYDRDHSTIVYWCQKMGVTPILDNSKTWSRRNRILGFLVPIRRKIRLKYPDEKINSGKSYKEYLREEQKKKYKNFLFLMPRRVRLPEGFLEEKQRGTDA